MSKTNHNVRLIAVQDISQFVADPSNREGRSLVDTVTPNFMIKNCNVLLDNKKLHLHSINKLNDENYLKLYNEIIKVI